MIHTLPVLGLAILSAAAALTAPTHAPRPSGVAPDVAVRLAASSGVVPDVDSARAEIAVGRFWHAARHLRELREQGMTFGPEETLLLARAEAGYRDWDGVLETLADRSWLAEEEGGFGLELLGMALEAAGSWEEAAGAYDRYLETPHGRDATDRAAVQVRRAGALARAGRGGEGLSVLAGVADASPVVASWAALEMAGRRAPEGDTALVRQLLDRVSDPAAEARAWRLPAVAALAAGDTARAVDLYRGLAASGPGSRRAIAHQVLGDVALARGDTAAAVEHHRTALDLGPGTGAGVAAARRLLDLDAFGVERALAAARVLDRAGADGRALEAYDLHVRSSDVATAEVRLARARLMAVTSGRHDEAVTEFRALSTSSDASVGAGALESWAGLRARQGRSGDVETLRRWLVERYPGSPQAVNHVFLRGDAHQDRLELDEALADYGRLQEMAPAMDRSGLARMRTAQIHLGRGDTARALDVFRGYLRDFPEGRRWEEASYWAGRLLAGRGDPAGEALLADVVERSPLSYYAVVAVDVLGAEYRLPGEPGGGLPPMPEWLADELRTVDLLAAAGLDEGRAEHIDRLTARALDSSPDDALRLARELIERDQTLDGVNLGWELRRRGMGWSRALLEVVYPFPHREMVHRAARARGLDPILVASIVRQESAFDPDIVSSAGAIGLMQVMPATGRQLAAAVGPRDFDPESLETPEINLHLGTRYVVELSERFGGRLPLILSAYNAGPHRAGEWQSFPEVVEMLRFTERIPYGETRDYVKLITRNLAVYGALYGRSPAS